MHLKTKTRRVLRPCHKAATRNASNFDSLLVDLATMKETNVEANELYEIGLRLIDPTSPKVKLKESMQNYERHIKPYKRLISFERSLSGPYKSNFLNIYRRSLTEGPKQKVLNRRL